MSDLRLAAWSTEPAQPRLDDQGRMLDVHDPTAHHGLVYDAGQLVAAVRLTVHRTGAPLPEADAYDGVQAVDDIRDRVEAVVCWSRLVVHPDCRGRGLARLLDAAALKRMKDLGHPVLCNSYREREAAIRAMGFGLLARRQVRIAFTTGGEGADPRVHLVWLRPA